MAAPEAICELGEHQEGRYGSVMKFWLFALCVGLPLERLNAQTPVWQPSPGHAQVPIWPGAAPDAMPVTGPEFATTTGKQSLVAGRPLIFVGNVSCPTMTVYPPIGKNTGVAIVVFPGGGYWQLAIDLEGTEICDWLTSKGVTCVLLKYRVPGSGKYLDSSPKSGPYPKSPQALEDAQRTLGLVRAHAAEWHIDPHKIGVLGFSAGGHLAAAMSIHFEQRVYPAIDAADRESCRPDFAVALYPGHLSKYDNPSELNPDIRVTNQAPPTFLLQSEDDPVDDVENSLDYYAALKKAGVPVEMHLYASGGHGFGLRRTKLPVTAWPQLVETWLKTIGMTSD
jgi:acetyl esterase/lipase